MSWAEDILDFWFGSEPDDAVVARERGRLWFGKSETVDRQIETRFGQQLRQAATGSFQDEIQTARERLALILLLDQFSRNVFRGQPAAFAGDPAALKLSLDGLRAGEHLQLRAIERVFLYLPLEHAEDSTLQQQSVALFAELLASVPEGWQQIFSGFYDYAVRHQQIIARFGRFPHRNAILGRTSTEEERLFLEEPGSSF